MTVVSVLLPIGLWSLLVEPNRLVLRHQAIDLHDWPGALDGLRIAAISDIHTDRAFVTTTKLRRIVETINEQQPDLIVLLGDYVKGTDGEDGVKPDVTAAVLRSLRAPLGVYAVLGNHDWWYNGQTVRRALEGSGIRVLDNEVAELRWRGGSFWLAGLADAETATQRIPATIAKAPQSAAIIALTHSPDVFPEIPQRVPLLLAGHTHGGQVAIPLVGPPFTASALSRKYSRGLFSEHGRQLFVTTGIGWSLVPVRFRVPPEIVVVRIRQGTPPPDS